VAEAEEALALVHAEGAAGDATVEHEREKHDDDEVREGDADRRAANELRT
jgi:hypothetical protein